MSEPPNHLPAKSERRPAAETTLEFLSAIPEERLWLSGQLSPETRRAYRNDVVHFMKSVSIQSWDDLRAVDRAAVLVWRHAMESEGAKPTTVRRRLSALSSLFSHLVHVNAADRNPAREVKRPRVNPKRGMTPSFAPKEARAILDAPDAKTEIGLRDRAILAIGFQVGPRRAEIAGMKVSAFHVNAGYPSLRLAKKGGDGHSVSINPQVAARIDAYLDFVGHRGDRSGPLFRPVRGNRRGQSRRRHLHPDLINEVLKKYIRIALGERVGYSSHSMRATFITRALENGASLEDVQEGVGHADPSVTKLYDRRGYNPEKSASFFATY